MGNSEIFIKINLVVNLRENHVFVVVVNDAEKVLLDLQIYISDTNKNITQQKKNVFYSKGSDNLGLKVIDFTDVTQVIKVI